MAEEHVAETPEVEAPAQEAVETNDTTLGWDGEPFDPERAKRTIENVRNELREIKERTSSDEWFQKQLQERGLALPDDDDEELFEPYEDEEDDDPVVQRLTALELAEQERAEQAALSEQSSHIDQLAEQYELTLTPNMKRWVSLESISNGFTQKATETAVKALSEDLEQFGKASVEKYLKSKRAPSPPGAGAAGQPSGDFDPKDDKSRKERMAAIFAARQEA